MIRVACIGDPHLTDGPRFDETCACLNFCVEDGIAQGAQLWLVTGDLVGHTVPYRSSPRERLALATLFQRMATVGPVVIITGNHDSPGDHALFGRLRAPHPIVLVEDDPAVLDTLGVPATVYALPFQHKRHWLTRLNAEGLDDQDRAVEDGLRGVFAGWRERAATERVTGRAAIMVGHIAVANALLAGGEIMPPGQEITLALGDLDDVGMDFVALGHIHQRQEMRPNAWFVGTASRSTFAEVDPKGYVLADVAPGMPPVVHVRQTPARPFFTIDAEWAQREDGTWGWSQNQAPIVTDAEVRIRVTVPEEAMATADYDALEAECRRAGAHAVKIERRVRPKQELRCPAVIVATTLEAQLDAYWNSLPAHEAPDAAQRARCLAKLPLLQEAIA